MNDTSYLKLLIGKTVVNTEYSTSTVVPLSSAENDSSLMRTTVFVQIYFEDYLLHIYNKMRVLPNSKAISDFIGLIVIDAYETKEEASLVLQDDNKLIVDLRDEAYSDPEAIYLTGPNDFWVVWN